MTHWLNAVIGSGCHYGVTGGVPKNYIQADDILSTKRGYVYGELSVVVSNIFMEHFEKLALDMVEHNHCHICMYDTLVILHCGLDSIQVFFNNIRSLRLTKVNMKTETDGATPFMDMLVIRKDLHWTPQPTENVHTMTITSIFNRTTDHMKGGNVQSLYHRSSTICQQQQYHSDETDNLRHNLQLDVFPIGLTDTDYREVFI